MDLTELNRIAIPAFTLLLGLSTAVLPTLRMKRRTGSSGYVAHRVPGPIHQVAVMGMWAFALGTLTWVALFAVLGGEDLGIWQTPSAVAWAGWSLAAVALVTIVVAQVQMGASWRVGIDSERRTALVTHGLFRVVRNPIFTGMLLAALGVVAMTPSAWSVMAWLFFVWVLALQTRLEEEHLLRTHGEAYRQYASQVGRFVPGVGLLTGNTQLSQQEVARG